MTPDPSSRTFTDPRVLRVLVLYVLARIPAAAVWLSIVLDVSGASGSYVRAGSAVAAYGVGVALLAPLMGRLADRFGARPVLLGCAAVQLPALLLLASSAAETGLALLLPAFVAGVVQPPLVPCMRAGWALLVPDEQARKACFSFDAVLGEVVDLGAPLIAVALNVSRGDAGSLQVVGVAVAVTTLLYVLVAPSAPGTTVSRVHRGPRVLTRPVLAVLLVVLLLTAALGAVEVAAIAFADSLDERSSAGLLLSLFTLGSIAGGVLHSRVVWSASPDRQLLLLLAPLAAGLALTAATPHSLWVAGPLLALAGVSVAPLVATLLGLLQRVAREGAVTETFTYATTANFLGVAGGSVLTGAVGDLGDDVSWVSPTSGGMVVAALLVLATAVAVLVVRPALRSFDGPSEVVADDDVAALVRELEQVWETTRVAGRRNEALAREIAEVRAGRRAGVSSG